jgi:hypothetical protein
MSSSLLSTTSVISAAESRSCGRGCQSHLCPHRPGRFSQTVSNILRVVSMVGSAPGAARQTDGARRPGCPEDPAWAALLRGRFIRVRRSRPRCAWSARGTIASPERRCLDRFLPADQRWHSARFAVLNISAGDGARSQLRSFCGGLVWKDNDARTSATTTIAPSRKTTWLVVKLNFDTGDQDLSSINRCGRYPMPASR